MQNNPNNEQHLDIRFGILSYQQFVEDLSTKKFNKMCLTEVVNADMMIATFGEEEYYKTCTEILQMGNMAYKQMGIDHLIHVYIHSYKTFLAVANDDMSDENFLNLMQANYEQYELMSSQQTGLGGVSRFVLSFGDDLVNKAKSAMYLNKDAQNNFLIASNEREILFEQSEDDVRKFELLNYAINNDKIIPYYQGIRDNENDVITKYEALMRIQGEDGKIYPPGFFLDASKRLMLYLTISKKMIDTALNDFVDKESELSINLSLLDVQSDKFQEWFLDRIKKHPRPEKLIIEFVETENYDNKNELFDFLNKIRDIGCKIAVDDFGVGYATYSSIISLKPDMIKIDGDIIKKLSNSQDCVTILESICYMAKLINAKTTAEFVENEEIQNIVTGYQVHYSQGYHFAKPEPFTALNIL